MNNPVKEAMEYLRACAPGECRVVALRSSGDGVFTIKTYRDGRPGEEVEVGGRKALDEALASLS